jgi:hypothetical protein
MEMMFWNIVLSLVIGIVSWILKDKAAELTRVTILLNKTREEIAKEYVEGFWTLYEPSHYLRRCFQQCLGLGLQSKHKQTMQFPVGKGLRLITQLIWHQGIRRGDIRGQFWRQLWTIWQKKPQVLNLYLGLCAAGEHFWEYRALARERITQQLGYDPLEVSGRPNQN